MQVVKETDELLVRLLSSPACKSHIGCLVSVVGTGRSEAGRRSRRHIPGPIFRYTSAPGDAGEDTQYSIHPLRLGVYVHQSLVGKSVDMLMQLVGRSKNSPKRPADTPTRRLSQHSPWESERETQRKVKQTTWNCRRRSSCKFSRCLRRREGRSRKSTSN